MSPLWLGTKQAISLYRYSARQSCGRWLVGVVGVIYLAVASQLYAEPPPAAKPPLQNQVRSLLQELDADQLARRHKAERELLDMGRVILPLLPPPELLPNPSVRATVARVRVTLERRKARESVQPAQITIASKNPKLRDWLQQIEAQTANHLDIEDLPPGILDSEVDQDLPQTTFWQALQAVLPSKQVRFQFAPDSSDLKLVPEGTPGTDAAWKVAIDGPFRVAVDSVRPRQVAGNSQQQRLRAELSVAPEPRLRALFLKLAAKDFRATGPGNRVFPASDEAAQFDLPLGEGGRFVRWNLDFTAPSTLSSAEIFPLKIEGQATMQIAAASEHIRFTDLVNGAGTARRRGGVTVAMQKVQAKLQADGTQTISIKVLVAYDTGGPAFESHRTWIFHNEVYLDQHVGDPLPANGGFETDLQANGAVGVTYHFQGLKGPLADYEFVYVAPTLIIDVPVKIQLDAIQPPS